VRAKVVDLAPPAGHRGAAPVALPFKLDAPAELAGRPRTEVKRIASDDAPAALVTYGQGLDGIAVIESRARPRPDRGAPLGGLELPKVALGAASGQELDTALGTAITFTRDGFDYVVLGSVPPATAQAAARGL